MLKVYLWLICICIFSCVAKSTESTERNTISKDKNTSEILNNATQAYSNDDFESAIKYYDSYIEKESMVDAEVYYRRGYCNARILNLTESTNDYLKAAELGYREADAYYNAGINSTLDVKDSLAIYFFKESLKYNPNDTIVQIEIKKAEKRIKIVKDFMNK